jgi:hypothetical protein
MHLGEVDYAKDSHTILGLHANAGITFDLAEIAKQARLANPRFRGVVGYGGRTSEAGADFFVFLDGEPVAQGRIGFDDGGIPLDIPLPPTARFLTLVATDAGNSIGMDQIFFGDARIEGDPATQGARQGLRTGRRPAPDGEGQHPWQSRDHGRRGCARHHLRGGRTEGGVW